MIFPHSQIQSVNPYDLAKDVWLLKDYVNKLEDRLIVLQSRFNIYIRRIQDLEHEVGTLRAERFPAGRPKKAATK